MRVSSTGASPVAQARLTAKDVAEMDDDALKAYLVDLRGRRTMTAGKAEGAKRGPKTSKPKVEKVAAEDMEIDDSQLV